MRVHLMKMLLELRSLLVIAAVIFPFRASIADWNDVPTGSMIPTILEGDRIAVNKLAYDLKLPFTTVRLATWDHPRRGDIVVLFAPDDGKRLVKRVIGLPGDTLALRDNQLWINGAPIKYVTGAGDDATLSATELLPGRAHVVQWLRAVAGAPRTLAPIVVPPGHYFMMGDNRDNSRDSRSFGMVAREHIVGRAYAVALSFAPEAHYAPRWQRFFTALN